MKSLLLKSFDLLSLFRHFNRYTANTATVFMMHNVLPDGEESGAQVTSGIIKRYLTYLKKSGYNVISLTDYVAAIRERKSTYNTVVFTVDDGYRDFYLNCYPVFREFNYPATVFITGDFIEKRLFMWWDKIEFAVNTTEHSEIDLTGRGLARFSLTGEREKSKTTSILSEHCKQLPDAERREFIEWLVEFLEVDFCGQPKGKYEPLTWDEILEMSRNGIEFYPHSKTHPIMSRIPYRQKLLELTDPKRLLEERLNREMEIFCYPNGTMEDIDAEVVRALEETGYRVAVTGLPGFNTTRANNNMFMMHRFALPADHLHFKQYISGMEFVKDRLRRHLPLRPFR